MAREGRETGTLPETTEGRAQKGGWKPSRGFKIGISGVAFFAGILTVASIIAVTTEPDTGVVAVTPTPSPQPTTIAPRRQGPADEFTSAGADAYLGAVDQGATTAHPAPATSAGSTAGAATATPTIGEGWSATPAPIADAPEVAPAASGLIAGIESRFGVDILTAGQDWGVGEADQVRNLGAVQAALQALPPGVISRIVSGSGGTLSFLSNQHGQTAGGWQPYGDRAANYYTNQDYDGQNAFATNQVILQPGSAAQTIAHELVHAYQLRDTAPGAFVEALLTPEMKSFMQATGWKQLVSDEELLAVQTGSWDGINSLFSYQGHSLSYVTEHGSTAELYTPNPMEAFAEAAGLYYAHGDGFTLPAWADYWSWFNANLG